MDYEDFLVALGASIAGHRRAAGLTQEQLAERLQSSPQWVSQIERGVGKASMETLLAIANALETDLPAIIGTAWSRKADDDRLAMHRLADHLPLRSVQALVAAGRVLSDDEEG